MDNVPRSKQFDDVYFSVQDGLAETRHVFLDGNNLPEAWQGRDHFTICETGFGTGLNFLAVLQLLARDECRPKNLHFISFEKYPLTAEYIKEHLTHWDELSEELSLLLSEYPSELNDEFYELGISEGVKLTLYFGDINDVMPRVEAGVDCWFLDGFKPSANPEMWSETVFANMARMSAQGTSFATFTAAGFVRRGLAAAGFDVRKVKGYGRKREMCVGAYIGVSDAD